MSRWQKFFGLGRTLEGAAASRHYVLPRTAFHPQLQWQSEEGLTQSRLSDLKNPTRFFRVQEQRQAVPRNWLSR